MRQQRRQGEAGQNPAPCPAVVVLKDAARLVEFAGDQTLENVAWSGEFVKAQIDCRITATSRSRPRSG